MQVSIGQFIRLENIVNAAIIERSIFATLIHGDYTM